MLDRNLSDRLLLRALARGGTHADIFCEARRSATLLLQQGELHQTVLTSSIGVGIRVISNDCVGYAHSDDLSEAALMDAAAAASSVHASRPALTHFPLVPAANDVRARAGAGWTDSAELVDILQRADIAGRGCDPRITNLQATIADELQEVWIATSDGRMQYDRRPLVSLNVLAFCAGAKQRTQGHAGDGGRYSLSFFEARSPESIACEAAERALTQLDAVDAPAGEMEIILGAGGGGVLLHEAVGHGLEGDFNRRGVSIYSSRLGERVASELVTIFDEGNIPGERGSSVIDDEGEESRRTVLVENGILRSYMNDKLNAELLGQSSTGNGRRQSFRVPPQPRMSITHMPSGTSDVDEIFAGTKRGIYAKSFAGGQVDIGRGDFVFMIAEGFLVENGRVTAPIRNATVSGNGPDIMNKVVAVGNDSRLAAGYYSCGKGGQQLPVGVGMPTVKISAALIGGSRAF